MNEKDKISLMKLITKAKDKITEIETTYTEPKDKADIASVKKQIADIEASINNMT